MVDAREAFYGGAAGGGKSDVLLAAALQYVDIPQYAAILFRRTFADLALPGALMDRAASWLTSTDATWNHERKTWTFPSGASLTFGYLENENDVHRYQSAEFQYIGFDELTQFSEKQYTYLFSRLRRLTSVPLPIRMRSASNPGGLGHEWVKRRFIDERKRGTVFVPAKLSDNPHVDRGEYMDSLSNLSETLQRQLVDGDWGAFEGAAFPDFDRTIHCVPAFKLEDGWKRFESMDYGLSAPTAWLAWAIDYEGNHLVHDMLYAPGLPSETAPNVLVRRREWRSRICYGDPNSLAMRTSTLDQWGKPATIESEFANHGVPLLKGNDNPKAGYTRLRELVKPDPKHRFPDWHPRRGEYGSPRLFISARHCPELVEQMGIALLQPIDEKDGGEKVSPKWETKYGHAIAAARYGVLGQISASESPVPDVEPGRNLSYIESIRRNKLNRNLGERQLRWEIL